MTIKDFLENTIYNHEVTNIIVNNTMFYALLSEIGIGLSSQLSKKYSEEFSDIVFHGIPITILNSIEDELEETKICYVATKNGLISYDDVYANYTADDIYDNSTTISENQQDIKMSDLELIWNGGKV